MREGNIMKLLQQGFRHQEMIMNQVGKEKKLLTK